MKQLRVNASDEKLPPKSSNRRVLMRRLVSALVPPMALSMHAPVRATQQPSLISWPDLHPVNGPPIRAGDMAGIPSVVVFWETWCPYCKRHNERIEALYQATRSQKFRVMGLTTESDEARVKAYLQSEQLHFTVAMVDAQFRAQFSSRTVIPLTCVVAASGQLLQAIPGEMALDDVLSLAAQAMGVTPKISLG